MSENDSLSLQLPISDMQLITCAQRFLDALFCLLYSTIFGTTVRVSKIVITMIRST